MIVFRLESRSRLSQHGLGKGCYNYYMDGVTAAQHLAIYNRFHQPMPVEDTLLVKNGWTEIDSRNDRDDWFFGFESIEQMHNWFVSPDRDDLEFINSKMCISAYEVNEVVKGAAQLVFNAVSARLIDQLDCTVEPHEQCYLTILKHWG